MDKQRKKELIDEYKQRPVKGGVFRILNTVNGKALIKAAINLEAEHHKFEFAQKTGTMYYTLAKDWNEVGGQAFTFEILEETEQKADERPATFKDRLKKMEEKWREQIDGELLY